MDWLVESQDLTREGAVIVGEYMRKAGLFEAVKGEQTFRDGKKAFYRFKVAFLLANLSFVTNGGV